MVSVTVKGIINAERQLEITLPDDLPAGAVELTITPVIAVPETSPGGELTRERLRALLAAEGALVTTRYAPPDAKPLTDKEHEELGKLHRVHQIRCKSSMRGAGHGEWSWSTGIGNTTSFMYIARTEHHIFP